jgi:alpha-galactosidase
MMLIGAILAGICTADIYPSLNTIPQVREILETPVTRLINPDMLSQTITLESQALRVKVLINKEGAAFLQEVLPLPGTSPTPTAKTFSDSYAPLVEVRLAGEGTK